MGKKINIILCDTFPGLLPAYIKSYASLFENLFDSASGGCSYEIFAAMDGSLPQRMNRGELYLITGCNLSAYDDIGWIHALSDWIRRADEAEVKLTGICFGHQLIAHALGGKVVRAAAGWGTGIRESEIVDGFAARYFPDGRMRLMYNHHDQVTALPPGSEPVARSGFCPIESFRKGMHILTFQGHPEYVPEYNRHLIENFAENEPEEVKRRALESLDRFEHQGLTVAKMLLDWTGMDAPE